MVLPPASMTTSTQSPFTAASGHSGCAAYSTCAPGAARQPARHAIDLCQRPAERSELAAGPGAASRRTLQDGPGGPAVPAPLQCQRNAEALGQVALGKDVLQPAQREH